MTTLDQAKTHSSTRSRDFAPGGLGFDWIITVLIMVATAGVLFDEWSHRTYGGDQSVLNPFHITFFAGDGLHFFILLCLWLYNVRRGYAVSKALPQGYLPALIALGAFGASGIADQLGHALFGFEVGLEGLLSPTHVILFLLGGVIIAGPLRATLARLGSTKPSLASLAPLLGCTGALLAMFEIALTLFLPLSDNLYITQALATPQPIYGELIGVAGIVLQILILVGVLLWLTFRVALPTGALSVTLLAYGLLNLVTFQFSPVLLPVWLGTGVAADLLYVWLKPTRQSRARVVLFSAAVALVLWGLVYLIVGTFGVGGGFAWSRYIRYGAVVYAAVAAALLGYLMTMDSRGAKRA